MFHSLLRIMGLIRKELLVMLKDRRSLGMLILAPLLQTLIFGYAATYDLNNVPYALVDFDASAASRALASRLDGAGIFTRIATPEGTEPAFSLLEEQQVVLVVVVGSGFEAALTAGRSASIQVIADGRNSNTGGTAQGYVNAVTAEFTQDWRSAHGQPPTPVRIETRAWYNPGLETRWNMIPSLVGTITMLLTLMLTAMSVAREREEGTFDQLLVSPMRPIEIMIGKALPAMLVGLVQANLVFLVALFWFRIPFAGSYIVLLTGLILFLAAAIGIGLLISSIATNMQQAMIMSFLLLMPFILLSGLMAPAENMPQWLQYATLINPLRYAIEITRQVYLEGAGFALVLPQMLSLLVIAAIALPVAARMFRNRLT